MNASGTGPSPAVSLELESATELAALAGRQLLQRFRLGTAFDPGPSESGRERLEVEFKGRRDLVTDADYSAETIILEGLRSRFPDDAILSEEAGSTGSQSDSRDRTWIVDPLDGTTNFAHGHPFFAVSIALVVSGRPEIGVIHAPALGESFRAQRDGGAWLGERRLHLDGTLSDASSTSTDPLANALLATGFSYSRSELDDGGLELFGALLRRAREIRRAGSAALDLAYVASGTFAGFWEYYLKPHDVAAGALLVEEAGGVVTDVRGGPDWLFGRSMVAASPGMHAPLLDAVGAGPSHPGQPSATARDESE